MKHRLERVKEVLKRELGSIIQRELNFAATLVTVNAVDITPDLKQAHVFISAIGNEAQKRAAIDTLEQNRPLLQHLLSRRVILKYTPRLNFKIDDSVERGARVIEIMDSLGLSHKDPSESDEQA